MYKLSLLDKIAIILVLIGAVNWGLIGLFGLDIVRVITLGIPILQRIVYIAVGLSGVLLIVSAAKSIKNSLSKA